MHGKALSYRECVQVLNYNGFEFVRHNGDHAIFKHSDGRSFVITHKSKLISQKTWKRECRKVGIVE